MDTDTAAPAATVPRLEGESADAYAACMAYCALGTARSTAKVGQRLGKSKTLMDRWSARWHWVARAAVWDTALATQAQAAYADESVTIARQHAQEAARLREMALYALAACDRDSLPAAVALRIWTEAVRIERLSLGLPTDNTASKIDLTATADVRHEVETVKRLMGDPDVRAAIAAARRALSRQLQGQQGDETYAA